MGKEAVKWLTRTQGVTREIAIRIGQRLIERNIIHHVVDDIGFDNDICSIGFYVDDRQ